MRPELYLDVSDTDQPKVTSYCHHGAQARAVLTRGWAESLCSSTGSAQTRYIGAVQRAQVDQQRSTCAKLPTNLSSVINREKAGKLNSRPGLREDRDSWLCSDFGS